MKTYYLYRHIREDKNEPFYIGIGVFNPKGKSLGTKYKRAFESKKNCRNRHWHFIILKTSYIVEILFESDNFNLICEKEKEFIKLYGRNDLKQGNLVNLTDGGDTPLGYKPSQETINKMKKNNWVRGRFGELHHLSKPVYVYSVNGEFIKKFGSYNEASRELKIDTSNIKQIISGKCQQCYNMIFFSEYKGEKIDEINITDKKIRKVSCLNDYGMKIKSFDSVSSASQFVNTSTTHISRAANNSKYTCKGYYWKYDN